MYKVTERRLTAARPILEKYRAQLFARHSFDTHAFEHELRDVWKTGYQEIKDVVIEITRKRRRSIIVRETDRYREVAAYYMENDNGGRTVSEFQHPLAELYGISHFHADDRGKKRDEYWKKVFVWGGVGDRMDEDEDDA
jgi:hypothetical protein